MTYFAEIAALSYEDREIVAQVMAEAVPLMTDRRGAVQAVQDVDGYGVGRLDYRGRGRLNEAIVSVRHTRRRVMNRTFKTPEFIGGPVTDA